MTAVVAQDGTVTGDVRVSLFPLKLHMESCATQEEMNGNLDATRARGYTGIVPFLGKYGGEVSICGAAPSLRETYKELRGDVLAINSAIGFLISEGVIPKWAMLWDAAEVVEQFAVPHPDVTYLVAARCHPKVFERLKDCKVFVWFAGGDHNIVEYMQKHELGDPLVNGGSAGVTRGLYLASALGYRKLRVFGADSSYSDDGATHVNGSLVPEKDMLVWIGKGEGSRVFRTTPEWCSQVNEFRDIYHFFRHPALNIEVDVYGDGMLPHMAKLMKMKEEKGLLWNKDGTPIAATQTVENAVQSIPQPLEGSLNAGV